MSEWPSISDQKAALEAEIAKLKAEPLVVDDESLKQWSEVHKLKEAAFKNENATYSAMLGDIQRLQIENVALKAKIARVEAFANRPYREGFDMTREQYDAVTILLRAALADEEKA